MFFRTYKTNIVLLFIITHYLSANSPKPPRKAGQPKNEVVKKTKTTLNDVKDVVKAKKPDITNIIWGILKTSVPQKKIAYDKQAEKLHKQTKDVPFSQEQLDWLSNKETDAHQQLTCALNNFKEKKDLAFLAPVPSFLRILRETEVRYTNPSDLYAVYGKKEDVILNLLASDIDLYREIAKRTDNNDQTIVNMKTSLLARIEPLLEILKEIDSWRIEHYSTYIILDKKKQIFTKIREIRGY